MQVFGRQVIIELLKTPTVGFKELFVSAEADGAGMQEILELAAHRELKARRVPTRRLDQMCGDSLGHQGVAAEIVPPPSLSVPGFMQARSNSAWECHLLVLDAIHNPSNVGMILRTAAASGIDGVVMVRQGTAQLSAKVLKAASGVLFRVPIVEADTTAEALDDLIAEGFEIASMDAGGEDLFSAEFSSRTAWVLGNETLGVSAETAQRATRVYGLKLQNNVESLNVSAAAAVLCYEVQRKR